MNVLITSVSRKVGLVRAFQKALSDEGGGEVIAVDSDPLAPALYFSDKYRIVSPLASKEFLGEIFQICKDFNIKLIVPTRDEELPFFAGHKEKFFAMGVRVMVADPAVVKICQDKKAFIEFCRAKKFHVPRSHNVDAISIGSKFPLFVKPRTGKGGKNASIAYSKEELNFLLNKMPDAIVQEHIDSREYTVDLFADFSGKIISVVPRERIRIFGGESFISKTLKDWSLINECVNLSRDLGLIGHNTIQCFYDKKSIKFIEVNLRFGGAANLGFHAGVHTPTYLIKLLKGEDVKPVIGEFKDNYFMLRYTEDLFLEIDKPI